MPQDAIREHETLFKSKRDEDTLTKLLRAYIESGDPKNLEKGLSLGMSYLKSFETSPNFLRRFSELLLYIENDPSSERLAVELGERSLILTPKDPISHAYMGYVYWRLGRLSEAITQTEEALKLLEVEQAGQKGELEAGNERRSLIRANLAYYLAETGDSKFAERAIKLARAAYETHPKPSRADTLGYVLMRFSRGKGDLSEAQRYLEEAERDLGSDNPFVRKHLEELRKLLREA